MRKSVMKNMCMGHTLRIASGIMMLALLLLGSAVAVTEIDSCQTISEPGEYVLNTSILNSAPSCINITSSHVIFDGAGLTIDGTNYLTYGGLVYDSNTYGVHVYNSTMTLTNVTVKNLTVTDWLGGIFYQDSENGSIENNNVSSNFEGILLNSSTNNTLSNNNANSNNYGIFLDASSNNNLSYNNANWNTYYGILLEFSSDNKLMNNNFSNNRGGINLFWHPNSTFSTSGNNNNVISGNIASSNTEFGIKLYKSSTNSIYNNIASSNSAGIYLDSSSNNTLTNNDASSNSAGIYQEGIFLQSSSNNNTLTNNNASSNSVGIFLQSSSGNNTLTNNVVSLNTDLGIGIDNSYTNTIYNNYFNNSEYAWTINAWDDGNNIWNITKQAGTNIIGGPYLGGNYWSDYAGNDTDGDGLGNTSIPYNSSGNIINGGDYLPLTTESVTQSVSPGDTVATGAGTTVSDPVETSVTTPNAGTITIEEMPASQTSSSAFQLIGLQIDITAPNAMTKAPLVIVFQINSSAIPPREDQNTIEIFKNGVPVPPCTGSPGEASPDPCVSSRAVLTNGDIEITVLTSTASRWNAAVRKKWISSIMAPIDPVRVDTQVEASASFADHGTTGTHSAEWNWGDGTSLGTVMESGGAGSVTGSHIYRAAGVYTITLTVESVGSSAYQFMVVYDPTGGFVTGGGWIDSPAGAYQADPSLAGRANFGFVSKYKQGATVPTGQTEFQIENLNFHSTSYDWLVISGARAQFSGTGTINGAGNYGFLLTATDGAINGGGSVDKFRIKIWDKTTDNLVYDNVLGGSDDIEAASPQAISGGSIVIHKV
ncbi:MAG: right-handed parallel beta-helix repeat-containing protein [Candidatus Methanoperedens sp.]|nr:right-handed parallel beta-helix repeat-containing protein [Candidatus Methanoperedens sp.]